eukprot:1177783-Prorocentrum_minimum.AAC.1
MRWPRVGRSVEREAGQKITQKGLGVAGVRPCEEGAARAFDSRAWPESSASVSQRLHGLLGAPSPYGSRGVGLTRKASSGACIRMWTIEHT